MVQFKEIYGQIDEKTGIPIAGGFYRIGKIYNYSLDGKVEPDGNVTNGYMIKPDGNRKVMEYAIKDGKPNGQVFVTYSNKATYQGSWDGMPDGYGKFVSGDKSRTLTGWW